MAVVVGADAAVAEYAWKEWGIQGLVLLSFTLQVVLLILAEFRRSTDSGVLRLFLWSAYLLADATAIYVLGHMSVTGRSPEHKLVAFWAPFLLLHLGGQDNITAYAIEDNRLWLRHLQTFAVQVAAAAYVLYQSSILREAAVLMLVVGAMKYGERVWTLRCADRSPSGGNYRSFEPAHSFLSYSFDTVVSLATPPTGVRDTEALLVTAHLTLDVAKELFKGRLPYGVSYGHVVELPGEEVYKVVEMQLSLMHDALYTKLQVTRSWYGLCIRAFTVPSTAVALLLFHLHHRLSSAGDDRVDIAVTYILLVGAVVLEAMGMLRAVFSSWMCALLATRCRTGALASVRRLVRAADWRRQHWSGSMGQLNLLELHARSRASRSSRIARCIGVEDTWNTLWHTSSTRVSSCTKELLLKQLLKSKVVPKASPDHILNSRGRAALKGCGLHDSTRPWPGPSTTTMAAVSWARASSPGTSPQISTSDGTARMRGEKRRATTTLRQQPRRSPTTCCSSSPPARRCCLRPPAATPSSRHALACRASRAAQPRTSPACSNVTVTHSTKGRLSSSSTTLLFQLQEIKADPLTTTRR
jgi:hypothetical protein